VLVAVVVTVAAAAAFSHCMWSGSGFGLILPKSVKDKCHTFQKMSFVCSNFRPWSLVPNQHITTL